MTLGVTPKQGSLLRSTADYCGPRLSESSIYSLLHRESHRLFPDELFADLFQDVGRGSIPPRIVAVVMALQRAEGLSDREAVDRFSFDLRWKFAAGGLDYDYPGFVHTVLVDMRARLRVSDRPDRIFELILEVCRAAGLVGRKRVLDSTALYDAVATQDTTTLIRSAIRGLLRVADAELAAALRAVLERDDDYVAPGKPVCDWDDGSFEKTCARPESCSRLWSARIWSKPRTAGFESLAGLPKIASSPRWIRMLDTVTRPLLGALTDTKGTSRSTPTPR
jgi:hypothetical protein